MSLFIGVDGGGTSTRAVIVGDDGEPCGRASVGGAVASTVRPEEAADAVRHAARAAAEAAGVTLPGTALWAGLAGAGHEDARQAVERLLDDGTRAQSVAVGTDVEAAFRDAFPEGPGVLLIAGTGSIAWFRGSDGRVGRVGGRGRDLGDEGSGFWLGREGLRLVLRAADGRAAPTALSDALTAAAGVTGPDDLVPWTERVGKREVAALAPIVAETAERGDPGAGALVDEAVQELVGHVRAASRADAPGVVLWGGLVAGDGPLRSRLVRALEAERFAVLDRPVDPVLGAAMLARRLVGRSPAGG